MPHWSIVVTKKEIVKTISDEIGLTQLKTKEIVQKTFDAIVEALVEEGRIELRNFGVFEVKKRAARKARNPRTGDKVHVPEKFVVTFKPGKEMEEKVRRLEEKAAADRARAEAASAMDNSRNAANFGAKSVAGGAAPGMGPPSEASNFKGGLESNPGS
jgi:nucleoid DNA-binding protein